MDKKPLKDHVPAPESEEVTIPNDPMRALVNLTIDSALSKQFRKNSLITICAVVDVWQHTDTAKYNLYLYYYYRRLAKVEYQRTAMAEKDGDLQVAANAKERLLRLDEAVTTKGQMAMQGWLHGIEDYKEWKGEKEKED